MLQAVKIQVLLMALAALPVANPARQQEPSDTPDATPASQPPANVVLIFTDDLRADALGCTGHPYVSTPHLDRIAREGALLDNAFVITPLCCPSRATVLSGLYTHRSAVTRNGDDLDYGSVPLLPGILGELGYRTAFIGKYHMGTGGKPRAGFDYWAAYHGKRGQGQYLDARLNINGVKTRTDGYSTDVLTDLAVKWIQEVHTGPFFLLLSLKNVHLPMQPPPRHQNSYASDRMPLPPSLHDESLQQKTFSMVGRTLYDNDRDLEDGFQKIWRTYTRMVPSIDDSAGRIYQALQETGVLESTALIFSSDNGMLLGEHGLFRKGLALEPSIRVPLIIRHPGTIPPGTRFQQQVLNLDLAPTILDLAGAAPPAGMSGRSLVPVLTGATTDWRQAWLFIQDYPTDFRPGTLAVRSQNWKYIRHLDRGLQEQLFSLLDDPGERANLAADPAHHGRLLEMRQQMKDLMLEEAVPGEWWEPRNSGR